jgi:hypothetical protein
VCADSLFGSELKFLDVFGHRPPVALFHLEGHLLAFCERLITGHVDRRVVNEYVLTIFLLDKTIAFPVIEPLYNAVCQNADLLFQD